MRRWLGLGAGLTSLSLVGGAGLAIGLGSTAQADQVTVRSGDTLTALAVRYGTTPWALARTNRLSDANHIEIGQHLTVPSPISVSTSAGSRGVSRRVTVTLGQTLSAIASRYGVTVAQLVAANDITDPDMVRAGSTLVIPGAVVSSSSSSYLSSSSGLGGFGGPSVAVLDSSYGRARLADFSYWSAHYGVPVNVIEALTWWESGWNNNEVSATGAIGIGELEPATVSYVNNVLLGGTRLDPSVPSENIWMTAAFLAHLIRDTAGNLGLAVAAYYQGLASIRARGEYHDTAHYVAGVMAYARVF